MATLTGLTTNYFATPKEGFTTTLASTISSGAATVPLNSITGYTNGAIITLVVDPTDASKKQAFTGVVDTAGVQVTSVVWTEGTNQSHTAGSTVVDYVTATHFAALVKGLTTTIADQDGTLKNGAVDVSAVVTNAVITTSKLSLELQKGWEDSYNGTTVPAPNTVTNNGNRSYDLLFNSTDLTGFLSAGQRLKLTRTVTAPTQCTSLNGTTQYYNKTSPNKSAFTDDFNAGGWVKLSSYASCVLISRFNGTSGWGLYLTTSGQPYLQGYNAGVGNASYVLGYQSLPLNRWVHVATQLDMSAFTATTTTSFVMIDGVDVPSSAARGGTNPTALVQAGNLEIGSHNGGLLPFPGKIAQAFYTQAKVTQAQIRSEYMCQTIAAGATNLGSAYSFNNAITDLNTTTPNDLTAQGSAVATNADSPFGQQADGTTAGTTEYAIITKTAFSTNTTLTVQVPEGNAIPTSGGVSAVSYSTQKVPYGFPASQPKWRLNSPLRTATTCTSNATYGSFVSGGWALTVPIGSWVVGWQAGLFNSSTTEVHYNISPTALTGLTAVQGYDLSQFAQRLVSPSAANMEVPAFVQQPRDITTASIYVMYSQGATTASQISGSVTTSEIFAEFALL
jgi:hypothetical protein